jgi:hypothetical protein
MDYRQSVFSAYLDSARKLGLDSKALDIIMLAFDTGYSAGVLHNEDNNLQQEMIEALSTKIILN